MRVWSGRAFQVAGPACENARSPNFVRSRGREWCIDEMREMSVVVRSPVRVMIALAAATRRAY